MRDSWDFSLEAWRAAQETKPLHPYTRLDGFLSIFTGADDSRKEHLRQLYIKSMSLFQAELEGAEITAWSIACQPE